MRRVAALDCGTNTVRLLVADLDVGTGEGCFVTRQTRLVRLGEGVDRTGRLAAAALGRAAPVLEEYAEQIAALEVEVRRCCATSAVREASNAEDFADLVRARLGVEPEVLTGAEEARLSFLGATRSWPTVQPVLVVDIGGGSTELVRGADGAVTASCSLDVGSVRLTERLELDDPPATEQLRSLREAVDRELDLVAGQGVDLSGVGSLVAVAGTATTLAALMLGLRDYDRDEVDRRSFSSDRVATTTAGLLTATVAEREALGVEPGRADVIGAGAVILERVLRRTGLPDLLVSDSDLLDAIAWSIAGSGAGSATAGGD